MWKAGTSIKQVERGFTFIELTIVLLILGVVAALAFPSLHRLSSSHLQLTARHLIRTVYFLADRAATTKRAYRLNYNLDRQEYWATVRSGDEFVPVDATVLTRTIFPSAVRFKDVATPRHGKVMLGETYTDFYPVGRVDKTIVHLTDEKEQALTLVVNPLRGRVRVMEGYVEAE